jgi:hypothetical protein
MSVPGRVMSEKPSVVAARNCNQLIKMSPAIKQRGLAEKVYGSYRS